MPLIVFDLDGTLVDSRRDLANSTNEMLEGFGAPALPVDVVAGMVGEGAAKLVARALKATGTGVDLHAALDRFREIYGRRLLEHTRPYLGILEMIRGIGDRARLAVVTNKPQAPTERLLEAFELTAAFNWVIGGDSGFPRKPDPASTRHLMTEAGAAPRETLFVGDSMIDIETARNAEVAVCVARYGFGHLRGELVLRGDELVAWTPAEVGKVVAEFIAGNRYFLKGSS